MYYFGRFENPGTITGQAFSRFFLFFLEPYFLVFWFSLGWLFKIELSDAGELDELMDADAYKAFVESES